MNKHHPHKKDAHKKDEKDVQADAPQQEADETAPEPQADAAQIAALNAEIADLKDKLGRLAADFENYRKRTAQEAAQAQGKGVSQAAEAMMPVYDDLERAMTMGGGDPAKLIPGHQNVQQKLVNIFSGLGLELTGKEGEAFDPQWHEAIQAIPGQHDDVIVQVYQPGFRMGDRLVRPARVIVSKKV